MSDTPSAPSALPPADPAELVTLTRFEQAIDAEMVRSLLASAGIPAQLADLNTVNAYGVLGNALGGIRLLVQERDLPEANALLAEYRAGTLALDDEDEAAPAASPAAPDPMPALWHPDWAAAIGMILGPLFPMLLHYQNWCRIGDHAARRRSLIWLLATLSGVLGISAYLLWIARDLHGGMGIFMLLSFPVLVLWYFCAGRRQAQTMLPWHYPRRPMGLAMLLGTLATLAYGFALGPLFDSTVTVSQLVADIAHEDAKNGLPYRIDANTRLIAVSASGNVLTDTIEMQDEALADEAINGFLDANHNQICQDPKMQKLLRQGMINDIQIVDGEHNTVRRYRISAANCHFGNDN
ncbi:putative signal transducing protein [Chitinilyticum piscinae]|uniref:DUF2007 domain-containing protein n=1 Tax=Chitinilyticum piscinae TaxID=2866724 RepID=A0A8J7FX18_9NEIS|nr:DUF2007 domain-containing protein [Chitinilyticum piscinae]MBE9608255.1 DUF2007 domain-containing protein [Chitinilyticum piscinae]